MNAQPVFHDYWHKLAANYKQPSTYQKLEERIEEIRQKYGVCSFDLQDRQRRTPLHVAVLSDNKAAISFFLDKDARFDITDDQGNTPIDYAMESSGMFSLFFDRFSQLIYKRNLDPYAILLHQTFSPSAANLSTSILKKMLLPPISLPSKPFRYAAHSHDFGRKIKHLLLLKPGEGNLGSMLRKADSIFQNIVDIANTEGIKVNRPRKFYYPRDHILMGKEGPQCVDFPSSEITKIAYARTNSFFIYFEKNSLLTFNAAFKPILGQGISNQESAFLDLSYLQRARTAYIEGGNHFRLTNASGKEKILIGEYHLYHILCQLRLSKYFETHPPSDNIPLSDEQILQGAEEMYALDLLRLGEGKDKKSGFLSTEAIEDAIASAQDNKAFSIRKAAIDKGLIRSFQAEEVDLEEARPVVTNYLRQKEGAKAYLAELFGVSQDDLHFIPQLEYHLDVFLQPGPRGSLFIPDFSYTKHILKKLAEQAANLGLNMQDSIMIQRYMLGMISCEEAKPLLEAVKKEVIVAGFIPIPAPCSFYDFQLQMDNPSRHVRFLNGVTGWNKDHYYYITLGAQVGPRLGQVFMKIYELFLQQYEPSIKVHYVGENPQQKGDFTPAMQLWNQVESAADNSIKEIGAGAGVHCFTCELETESHDA